MLVAAALLLTAAVRGADVSIGFQAPYVDCSACPATFLSAIEYINTNPVEAVGLLNVTVNGTLHNSTTFADTVEGAWRMLEDPGMMALVADLFSSRVRLSALTAEIHEKPQIGYGSTSDDFTKKIEYPFFNRVVSPDRFQSKAIAEAARGFGWERIGILFADEAYGSNFAVQMHTAAVEAGLIVQSQLSVKHKSTHIDMIPTLRSMMATRVKVVVLAAISSDVSNTLRAAHEVGMSGPEYTWFGTDGVMTTTLFTGDNADVGLVHNGMLGMFPRYDEDSATAALVREAVVTNTTWVGPATAINLTGIDNATKIPFDPWAYYVWDATVFAAKACAHAHDSCALPGGGWNGTCIQLFIRNTTLASGATGPITMDAVGDRPGAYTLLNLRITHPSIFVPVGTFTTNLTTNVTTGVVAESTIIWSSGTSAVPSSGDFSDPDSEKEDIAAIVAPIVVVFLLAIVVVAVLWKRNNRKLKRKLGDARAMFSELMNKIGELYQVKVPWTDTTRYGAAKYYWREDNPTYHPANARTMEKIWVEYTPQQNADINRIAQETNLINLPIGAKTYTINLDNMTQANAETGYTRDIKRVLTQKVAAGSSKDDRMPEDISDQEALALTDGALIKVTTKRRDGWFYGTIVYHRTDTMADGKSGWFPEYVVEDADDDLEQEYIDLLGDADISELDPPKTWLNPDQMTEKAAVYDINLKGVEAAPIIGEFSKTCPDKRIQRIQRIQNTGLWGPFAAKRIQIMRHNTDGYPMMREFAFHGTTATVAEMIIQRGFDRNFCGRNATYFGKGVYFARDASYSAQKTYSAPDAAGVQRMFAVHVLHGYYCKGVKDALSPEVRDQATGQLYDSTTDDPKNPGMWVTYRDSQAYPAYLIYFK